MKEIRLEQFDLIQDMILFFNDLAGANPSIGFFCSRDEVDFWAEEMRKKNIRVFQYDYLHPFKDRRMEGEGDLKLSEERKEFLNQKGKRRSANGKIAESVLMLLNPFFTELQIVSKKIWVDLVRKSQNFNGSITLEKFRRFVLSQWGKNIEVAYVFPWQSSEVFSAPFGIETFLKLEISRKCCDDLRRKEQDMLVEVAKKCQFLIQMPEHPKQT